MMDAGDFFIHFMEAAEEEMNKNPKLISKEKLESLLDIAIRSVSNPDSYKDDIIGYLDTFSMMESIYALQNIKGADLTDKSSVHAASQNLKGIDLFTLDLKVQWPVNLVLSRASMVRYQIFFRCLFYCRYIER